MGLILESALELAHLGFSTFPVHSVTNGACSCGDAKCRSQAKHPRITGWKNRATNDPSLVKKLIGDDDNIGIATGKKSNLLVIDVDPKNGGDNSFVNLKQSFGALEENTLVADTGGGGFHLFYQYEGSQIKNFHGSVFGAGIDIKANGGYVVGAPSIHISGQEYRWRDGLYRPAELPSDLEAAIGAGSARSRPTTDLTEADSIPEGERNTALARFAGRYRGQGNDFDKLYSRLQKVNLDRCRPPLPADEVKSIAESICRYEKGCSKTCFRDYWIRCLYSSQTRDLDHAAKGVLGALSQLMDDDGGNCTAPQKLIADKAGCSIPTVSKQLGQAVRLGWLLQWHLPKTNGEKGIYCRYVADVPKPNE